MDQSRSRSVTLGPKRPDWTGLSNTTHNGIRSIMKDSWVREDCDNNELAHLRDMLTHKELEDRVPKLICSGDVVVGGFKDLTQHYRGARCTHLIHCHIVTSPVAESRSHPLKPRKNSSKF